MPLYNIFKQQEAVKSIFGYENVVVKNSEEVTEKSVFGTPVWMSLEIDDFKYKIDGITYSTPAFKIPCCIVEVTRAKVVVETMPVGSKIQGTIKEYINQGDYQINIKGMVVNDTDNIYPEAKVNAIAKIAAAPVAVPVTHRLLNRLGIYLMVIKTESYPSKQGFENTQAFEWSCVSDSDVLLKLKQSKNIKPL